MCSLTSWGRPPVSTCQSAGREGSGAAVRITRLMREPSSSEDFCLAMRVWPRCGAGVPPTCSTCVMQYSLPTCRVSVTPFGPRHDGGRAPRRGLCMAAGPDPGREECLGTAVGAGSVKISEADGGGGSRAGTWYIFVRSTDVARQTTSKALVGTCVALGAAGMHSPQDAMRLARPAPSRLDSRSIAVLQCSLHPPLSLAGSPNEPHRARPAHISPFLPDPQRMGLVKHLSALLLHGLLRLGPQVPTVAEVDVARPPQRC